MPPAVRRAFLVAAAAVVVVAVAWAAQFDATPPAEFSFQNGTDPKTLDPHRATGQPESQILFNIFSGLLQMDPIGEPDEHGSTPMGPRPAVAKSYDVSADRRTYTFHLRDDATWSDGVPITAADFVWSWSRMLHPATACEYNFQLFALPHAEDYSNALVEKGSRVEVELWNRPGESPTGQANIQNYPRGTIRYGRLIDVLDADGQSVFEDESKVSGLEMDWTYVVDTLQNVSETGPIDWDGLATRQTYSALPAAGENRTHGVLVAFDRLGAMQTPDEHTLIVNLKDPLPYFPSLVAYYPLFPVPRHVVEKHGKPLWTKPENIVSNGPYLVGDRKLRDRVHLVKNETWYDADSVSLKTIDAISIEGQNTALNMYETGQIDWVTDPPGALIEELKVRDDFVSAPQLTVYFYRINTTRPPMNDVRVRRAIAMAINRVQIVEQVTRAGQIPAYSIVPPGIAGYESPPGFQPDLAEAARLLAEAGYPGGRGMPPIFLLYNTSEGHRAIAEVIQQQLQNNLNVRIQLQNMEWGSYLDKVTQMDYDIARAGWVGDYMDPNTFLDLWVSGGPQNNTGWTNPAYDKLIADAAAEGDARTRMEYLTQAEQIWIDEMPVIPIYFYMSINLIKPDVRGFFANAQDLHPLRLLRIDGPKVAP